jgi:hypothetical protein
VTTAQQLSNERLEQEVEAGAEQRQYGGVLKEVLFE